MKILLSSGLSVAVYLRCTWFFLICYLRTAFVGPYQVVYIIALCSASETKSLISLSELSITAAAKEEKKLQKSWRVKRSNPFLVLLFVEDSGHFIALLSCSCLSRNAPVNNDKANRDVALRNVTFIHPTTEVHDTQWTTQYLALHLHAYNLFVLQLTFNVLPLL